MKGDLVNTPYGTIKVVRKDSVAITVVKVRRYKKYHGEHYEANSFAHIEHKKMPTHLQIVKSNCGGWADPVASYDLDGNTIDLK